MAELGHLGRIRFAPEERFRPADIGSPLATTKRSLVGRGPRSKCDDDALVDVRIAIRRGAADIGEKLLALRVMNTVVFAAAAALSGLLLVYASPPRTPIRNSLRHSCCSSRHSRFLR